MLKESTVKDKLMAKVDNNLTEELQNRKHFAEK